MSKKKCKCPEVKAGEGWIVSFADLMTLLFCVFVVLYALRPEGKTLVEPTIKVIVTKIKEAFNEVPDIIPDRLSPEPTEDPKKVFSYFRGNVPSKPVLKKFMRSDKTIEIINEEMQEVKKLIDIRLFNRKRPKIEAKYEEDQPVTVLRDKDGFRIRLLSTYFFQPGSYVVTPDGLEKFRAVGKILKELNRSIVIEGHTDSSPQTGEISNWELSALRAGFVAKLFLNELDISPDKIKIAGFADTKPVATNRTAKGRQLNRRVDIKVEYDE